VRRLAKGLFLACLIVALAYLPAAAQSAAPDSDQSARLTDYLHAHRLPLVGAQVLSSSTGRSVMLFGYTATEFGKGDAEVKTRRFLKDSEVVISNHIRVRPELASMKSAPGSAAYGQAGPSGAGPSGEGGGGEAVSPDVDAYKNQQQQDAQQAYINQQTQQYMNQGGGASGNMVNALIPLLGMGLAIGLGGGSGFGMGVQPGYGGFGGGSSFGGGTYGSPFGGGSPYGGSPYGYPYGPSPYGGAPNPYP